MRSIPLAMTWEMLRRGWWVLALAALGANALPVLLFTLLRHDGALDPADQSQIIMNMVMVQINVFLFSTAAYASLGPPARLYTFPVSTSSIIAWHLVLGMLAVALELIASTAMLNAMFGLEWRLWGPALFAAVAMAAFQAAIWLTEKSGWFLLAISVVSIGLCLWFKSLYGPMFSVPTHYWTEVTPAQVAILLAIGIAAYVVSVYGVARNRCGQPPYSLGLLAWLERVFAGAPEGDLEFRDPIRAQLWFGWRKTGWVMPGIVGMGLFAAAFIWLTASRHANSLVEGLTGGGAMLSIAGCLAGFILGSVGRSDVDLQFGDFLATRPITSTEMARTILRTMAKSVLIAWMIWATTYLALRGFLWALKIDPGVTLPAELGWWFLPATLLGAWTGAGISAPLALAGRATLVAILLFGGITLFVGLIVFSKEVLSSQAQQYFADGAAVALGTVFVAWTVGAFAVALRRGLIGWPTLYFAASVWVALCALVAFIWTPPSAARLAISISVVGLLALSVAPLATAPLAVAWNRTR
jgi:hypothetical protein